MFYIKSIFLLLILLSFIVLLPGTVKVLNWGYWTHFSQQADSFLHGRLDIARQMDTFEYKGKYYWHQQPFPSVILIPFKLFSKNFDQSNMQFVLTIFLVILLYKLTRIYNKPISDRLLLISAFLFGSPVMGLILNPSSWYYAQLVTVTLMIGLILEIETKQRSLVLGILLACIIATRPSASFIIIPVIYFLFKKFHERKFVNNLVMFLFPLGFTIFVLLFFNYVRFENIFFNAYASNEIGGYMPYFRSLGVFSFDHLPTNLYYYFLISVNAVTDKSGSHLVFPYITYSTWGISLFLIAPFFLYAFKTLNSKYPEIRLYWIAIILNLTLLLLFFAPGWVQFGPRYTADFFPILYLLFLKSLPSKLTFGQQSTIILSCLFNIYLYTTAFIISS